MAIRNSVIGHHLWADFNKTVWDNAVNPTVTNNGKFESVVWELYTYSGPTTYTYQNGSPTTLNNYSVANRDNILTQSNRIYASVASNGQWTWLENSGDRNTLLTDLGGVINTNNFYGANFNIETVTGITVGPRLDGFLAIPSELRAITTNPIKLTYDMHAVPGLDSGEYWAGLDYGKGQLLSFNHTDLVNAGWDCMYAQMYDRWYDYGTHNESGDFIGHAHLEEAISHVDRVIQEPNVTLENIGIIIPAFGVYARKGSYGRIPLRNGVLGQNLTEAILTGVAYSDLYTTAQGNARVEDHLYAEEVDTSITFTINSVNNNGGQAQLVLDADYHTIGNNEDRLGYNQHIEIAGTTSYNGEAKIVDIVAGPGNTTITIDQTFVADETGTAQHINCLFIADDTTVENWRTALEAIGVKYFRTWFGGTGFDNNGSPDTEPQILDQYTFGSQTISTLNDNSVKAIFQKNLEGVFQPIMYSPDGSKWERRVDNAGNTQTVRIN